MQSCKICQSAVLAYNSRTEQNY